MKTKPLILISKCIEHGFCRYDGSQISSPFVKRIKEYVDIITVCPESLIGLSTPREAIRIVKVNNDLKLVYSLTGTDITTEMQTFTNHYIESLKTKNIHGAILKSRSRHVVLKMLRFIKPLVSLLHCL